jgi:GDP/UDP-N,N'-diacetylbacillosamine 2-epimerase (hydrolysing)
MTRKIAVVTGTRAEYGILYWLLKEIQDRPSLELQLLATGAHLSPEFGLTYLQIEEDGFPIAEKLEILLSADSETAISSSIGLGVISFAKAFERLMPDIVILLGDRYETLAAAIAALVARIPIAHIGGGHATEGAIDESIRHSISKMSQFHFASRAEHRDRIIQLGEDPERVFVTNTPLVDGIVRMPRMERHELEAELGIELTPPLFLIAYHPVTLEAATAEGQMDNLLTAVSQFDNRCVFIMPNADTGGRIISENIRAFVESHPNSKAFTSIRRELYLNLMRFASVVLGNSSSGILEAPYFSLPAVNIGDRQKGRLQSGNVIDSTTDAASITESISRALDPVFRDSLDSAAEELPTEDSSKQIVDILVRARLDDGILKKRFYDIKLENATFTTSQIGGT